MRAHTVKPITPARTPFHCGYNHALDGKNPRPNEYGRPCDERHIDYSDGYNAALRAMGKTPVLASVEPDELGQWEP